MNNVNPMSGPSIGRARPACSTRYSSSSPPSRPATAVTASITARSPGSPRTSEATASVIARQAVRQRSSQCVMAESAGASVNSSSGRWAYATPSGAQYITDPLPALTSGPRCSTYARAASVAPSAARESTIRVRFPTSGGPVSSQAMWRASTSSVSSAPPFEQGSDQVAGHRGVVRRGAGWQAHPPELERRERIGHLGGAPELERGAEGVPQGEPEHAADRSLPQVHDVASSQFRRIVAGHERKTFGTLGDRMQKIGPKHTMCRRVGEPLCGRPNCPSNKRPYPPGQHGRGRKRISEYQTRLVEKQKLRAIYGVSEAQMKRYYEKASNSMDVTGEELIRQLETRLDTVILRLGFALTTRQARQLVSHGHVKLDGKRINVPSARVKAGQTVELSAKAKNFISVREALEITPDPPGYLYRNKDDAQGVLSRLPDREEIPLPAKVEERLIVEFYSGR